MLSPPDAEAVSPHIKLTETASEIIGLVDRDSIKFFIRVKTGRDFIILP